MGQIRLSYNLDISDKSCWLTVTAAPAVRASFAYIQELGDFHCGPGYYTRRENLPSYLIKFCVQGEGQLNYDGQVYRVTPGTLFWIDCTKPQHYRTAPRASEWHVLWLHLYGANCREYYEAFLEQNHGSALVSLEQDAPVSDIFSRLLSIYQGGNNTVLDDIAASGLITQLMAICVQAAANRASRRQAPDYVAAAQAYINARYSEEITLESLAQSFSINKYYLQKLFRRHTGLSPNDYLTRTRLARAKRLLRTTDDTVTEIAQAVGYTATYFDKVFKKYEGITPKSYRQRWYDVDARTGFSQAAAQPRQDASRR